MISFKQFILESFLDTVADPIVKNHIKTLMKSGDLLAAYKEFHNSKHEKKPLIWSTINPKSTNHWKRDSRKQIRQQLKQKQLNTTVNANT